MLFSRQKTILNMLRRAGRPVDRLELMKWAFLLRHDTPSAGGPSFYGFVPYHYGPFSFCLQRDMGKLVDEGLVQAPDQNHWRFAEGAGQPGKSTIAREVEQDVADVVARFANEATPATVMDHVYRRFPGYTVHSKRRRLARLSVAPPAVYTAGYEGLSVDDFLDMLIGSGIRRLIDVRNNPVARRYGFHKSTLSRLCANLDIDYVHLPELGIESELRRDLDDQSDRDRLFDLYEQTTLSAQADAIDHVGALMKERSSVVVCMEAEPCACHRSRLAGAVSRRTGLPIIHLPRGENDDHSRA